MSNKRKIIFSILKEIEKGEIEPRAEHYGISDAEFGDIVSLMEEDGLIKGSGIARGGRNNAASVVFLNTAKITLKGLEYLEENNILAKTYKGLKEVRDWLRL
ncbi:MAG TPA: hypothetical protein GX723_06820 [Thermoanaerobacterales bacterium]|nr:hypothetical protein [Thermoanaerobacterales bacterium]